MLNEVGIVHYLLGFVLGHLCGSIPSGLWLVQAMHGIDIRNYGSKNIGTTNVFRTVGPSTAVGAHLRYVEGYHRCSLSESFLP